MNCSTCVLSPLASWPAVILVLQYRRIPVACIPHPLDSKGTSHPFFSCFWAHLSSGQLRGPMRGKLGRLKGHHRWVGAGVFPRPTKYQAATTPNDKHETDIARPEQNKNLFSNCNPHRHHGSVTHNVVIASNCRTLLPIVFTSRRGTDCPMLVLIGPKFFLNILELASLFAQQLQLEQLSSWKTQALNRSNILRLSSRCSSFCSNQASLFLAIGHSLVAIKMGDRRLNDLLKWSIENSETTRGDPRAAPPATHLTPDVISALMGGPSDADLMKASMDIITSTDADVSLEDRLIAFDNFEQLIESLDNANNLANLSLWTPLLEQLEHEELEMRKMAAWCVGTAVQNNQKTQERLLAMGGLPPLVHLATKDGEHDSVRRKAVYALSSAGRNYQPAMDAITETLQSKGETVGKVDATDMEAVDKIMNGLRERVNASA